MAACTRPVFLLLILMIVPVAAWTQSTVVINEFMAANNGVVTDSSGEFDDWVELYNTTSSPVDLSGYYFSDSYINPMKWAFPAGATIGPNGYVIVWCDNDTAQPGFHAYYKLNAAGERLILSTPGGAVVDSVSFGLQDGDTSTGRYPNGTGPFDKMFPTFAADNSPGLFVADAEENGWQIYPNPASSFFHITVPAGYAGTFTVTDLSGRVMRTLKAEETADCDAGDWPEGFYFLTTDQGYTQKIVIIR